MAEYKKSMNLPEVVCCMFSSPFYKYCTDNLPGLNQRLNSVPASSDAFIELVHTSSSNTPPPYLQYKSNFLLYSLYTIL